MGHFWAVYVSGTVILTGGTGFVGSHLVRALVADGRDVTILCRSFSNTKRIKDVLGHVRRIDLDTTRLSDAVVALDVAGVVHLATTYGRHGSCTTDVFRTNFLLPVEVLEMAIAKSARFFINTDSFFCKLQSGYAAMSEYTYSKTCFLGWAQKNTDRIHVSNIRLEHVYGSDDGLEKLVPSVLNRMLDPDVHEIPFTTGKQRRDFVFVTDIVNAYRCVIAAAEHASPGYAAYEAGTGVSVEIKKFIEKLRDASGCKATLAFGTLPYREGEIMDSSADLRTLAKLGYRPQTSLDSGITQLVEAARKSQSKLLQ